MMMMKSHSLRKAVEAAKWMDGKKGGSGSGQKESDHRVFEETQFINYGRSERSAAVGALGALVLAAPEISPPPERYERRHVF